MLTVVALLLIVLAVFHSIVGERLILQRIQSTNSLPEIWGSKTATFRTIRATWHLVSALWLALSGSLLVIVYSADLFIELFLIIYGVVFGLLALVPLLWNSGKHKTWILFATISMLLFYSAYLRLQ